VAQDNLIGKMLGDYEIEKAIGRGPFATIFRAYQHSAKRRVAVKLFPPALLERPDFLPRFEKEARGVARLEHFNILPIYEAGLLKGFPFLNMRYLNAGSLEQVIARQNVLPLEEALHIAGQIASALAYAHEHSILHRNLAPSNILFDAEGNAFLSDFGFPALREGLARVTGIPFNGKPAYTPPEVASGERVLTNAADVYSLGIIVYQMVTGVLPFNAESTAGLIMKHVTETPQAPSAHVPGLPRALDNALLMALAKSPSARFETAAEFAEALALAIRGPLSRGRRAGAAPGTNRPEVSMSQSKSPLDDSPGDEPRRRRRERRRAERNGVPWYTVLLVLLLLVVAWMALGMLIGFEFRRQANEATLVAMQDAGTQSAATATGQAEGTATMQALLALAETQQAAAVVASPEVSATTAPTVQPTATPTLAPTATPEPTATPLAGGGGLIALASDQDGDAEIFVLDVTTGVLKQLTFNEGTDRGPAWSPDGLRIAYYSDATGQGSHIFATDIEASPPIELTRGIRSDSYPLWSPYDGRIYFYYDDGTRSWINAVNLEGQEEQVRQIPRSVLIPFRWEDDGAVLVYRGLGPSDAQELMRINLTNGQRTPVTNLQGALEWADYSPDGQYIVYSALLLDTGRRRLYLADARCTRAITLDSCTIRPLTDTGYNYYRPRFSPDGSLILTASDRGGNLDLWLINLEGEIVSRLTDLPSNEFDAVWQPAP